MTFKFGIIGTSCSGKTTLAHALTARLKTYGVLVDGLFSQDRKLTFSTDYLETEAAQNWMITNLITQEVAMTSRSDVEVYISDRTPLDLFGYYRHQFRTPLSNAMERYVYEYCKTYSVLYYLEPLPYQSDNKRPSDQFRLAVDDEIVALVKQAKAEGVEVRMLPREEILADILRTIGLRKPTIKSTLSEEDLQVIRDMAGVDILVKVTDPLDTLADTDIWLLKPSPGDYKEYKEQVQFMVNEHFGPLVNVDIHIGYASGVHTFDFPHRVIKERGYGG